MKSFARLTVSFLLIMSISLAAAPLAPRPATAAGQQPQKQNQSQVRDVQVKTGAEVASRIKSLRETDRDVRAALGEFEKRGRQPRLDKAVTITGKAQSGGVAANAAGGASLFRQASFLAPRQQATMSENGVELTFITSLELYSEWQGTIIARRYDDYGNLIDEYVADAVITAPDNDHSQWTTRYEVSYVGGAPYLMHEPGMFTGFALGTSIQDHQTNFGAPPPSDIETWQFVTPESEQQYFNYYPGQWQYQTLEEKQQYQEMQSGGGGRIQPMRPLARLMRGDIFRPAGFRLAAAERGALFRPAAYQVRSDRSATREEMRQFCGNPNGCGPSAGQVLAPYTPRIKTWANNTAWSCSATAAGCGVVSAIFAEVPAAPCFVGGCTTMAVRNAFRDIFHVMN